MQEKKALDQLLGFQNSRDSFSIALKEKLETEPLTKHIGESTCENQHRFANFLLEIFVRFFNVMSKNFVSEENDQNHERRKRHSTESKESKVSRKTKKLQSEK